MILVDEAQDIGPEHEAILEMLVAQGCQLSLIGDKNQGIYDFSGATGAFLSDYSTRAGVAAHTLTINYRSVPAIVAVANRLAGRSDAAERVVPSAYNGAYYVPYKKGEKDNLQSTYRNMVESAAVPYADAAILCRSSDWVDEWRGGEEAQGQGAIRSFINAVVCRDKLKQYEESFHHMCAGLIGILADPHADLWTQISRNDSRIDAKQLKRVIWGFARDPETGLPAGKLVADIEWHPLLLSRLKEFLKQLEADFSLKPADNLGNRLAKKALLNRPIIELPDLATAGQVSFQVSTVHQVKGEVSVQ